MFFDVSAGFDSFPRVGVVCFGRVGLVVVKSLRRGNLVWGSFSVVVIRGCFRFLVFFLTFDGVLLAMDTVEKTWEFFDI